VFGERGAVVMQFAITAIVILALVAVAWWLVRRFTGGRLGAANRGRLPRLAIVDAMPIDNRRKLVLVRRDNVEHLILIGGPSDVVVEPAIVRTRTAAPQQPQRPTAAPRPGGAQTAAAPPPPPPPPPAVQPPLPPRPVEVSAADEPIPFAPRRPPAPQPRREPARAEEPPPAPAPPPQRQPQRRPMRPASAPAANPQPSEALAERTSRPSARFAEPVRATRVEQVISLAEENEPVASLPSEESPPVVPSEPAPSADMMAPEASSDPGQEENVAPPVRNEGHPINGDPDTATKVSDLEKEMARLLGEISSRRSS
jgi:hypothetical protein